MAQHFPSLLHSALAVVLACFFSLLFLGPRMWPEAAAAATAAGSVKLFFSGIYCELDFHVSCSNSSKVFLTSLSVLVANIVLCFAFARLPTVDDFTCCLSLSCEEVVDDRLR